MAKLWQMMISLTTCCVALTGVCVVLAGGSFLLRGDLAATINSVPLAEWLLRAPLSWSWWLWLAVVLTAVLVINTAACSAETVRQRWRRCTWSALLGPQLTHAGFLLIVAAHGISAAGGSSGQIELSEGMTAALPDGSRFGVLSIRVDSSPAGMPLAYACDVAPLSSGSAGRVTLSPNHPWFSGGYGVYLKQASVIPYRRALLEVHREPGGGMALAGALIFSCGCLLLFRRQKLTV